MRLIDADALEAEFRHRADTLDKELGGDLFHISEIVMVIDKAPTIPLPDFKEGYRQAILDGKTNFSRPQGEWIVSGLDYKCSNCGMLPYFREYNFCPNCGADMRKG